MLAKRRREGADDALILDTGGMTACTSMANIFVWEDDALPSPRRQSAILPGITRAVLLDLRHRHRAREETSRRSASRASGIFVTNSLMGLVPVSRIDGREVPAHPLTARLAAAYELLLDAAASGD